MITNLDQDGKVLEINPATKIVTLKVPSGKPQQEWTRVQSSDKTHFTLRNGNDYLVAIGDANRLDSLRGQERGPLYCEYLDFLQFLTIHNDSSHICDRTPTLPTRLKKTFIRKHNLGKKLLKVLEIRLTLGLISTLLKVSLASSLSLKP